MKRLLSKQLLMSAITGLLIFGMIGVATPVDAQPKRKATVPNTFTANSPAKASEVNADFDALATAIDTISHTPGPQGPIGPAGPNDITGNLTMVNSTATVGNILKGSVPFIHNFGTSNTFIGIGAGNLTMTGGFNTASG